MYGNRAAFYLKDDERLWPHKFGKVCADLLDMQERHHWLDPFVQFHVMRASCAINVFKDNLDHFISLEDALAHRAEVSGPELS